MFGSARPGLSRSETQPTISNSEVSYEKSCVQPSKEFDATNSFRDCFSPYEFKIFNIVLLPAPNAPNTRILLIEFCETDDGWTINKKFF
jgi:hypothetical protein